MATELFSADRPATVVTSGGTDAPAQGATETWTVASSASFPAAVTNVSQFHVADASASAASEMILVTNVSGDTWTVTRGAEGTTPVAHAAGFTVWQVVTSGALTQLRSTDWLNVASQFGADPTGVADSTTAIQNALNAAGNGQPVYFPAGTYTISSPLDVPIWGVLIGAAGNRGEAYGAVIQPSSGFSGTAALVLTAGNVSLATGAIRITDLVLNGTNLSGSEAGIYAAGYVHAAVLTGVRITGFPGAGIQTAASGGNVPYSWTLDQVEVATSGSHGFALSDLTDSLFLACRSVFNTGDGYNFNVTSASASGANTRLVACIAEENANGFNISSSTSAFAHTFYGCSTQNNNANGFLAASTGTDGLIQLVGCRFWEDGQNAGSGGGSYAGINLDALTGDVLISGCSVLPNNTGTPTVPEYGLSMTTCTGQVTVTSSEIWGYTQAIYNGGGNTKTSIGADVVTGTGTLASPTRGPQPYPPQLPWLQDFLPDALNGTAQFPTGIGSWTGNNSATVAWTAGPGAQGGLGCLGITGNGTTASPGARSEEFTVTANHFYSAAALVYSPVAWSSGRQMLINWFTSGGTYISTSAGQSIPLPAAGWVLAALNGVKSPATAGKAQIIVQVGGTPPNTDTFYVLAALLVSGSLDGFLMPLASSQVQGTTDWLNVVSQYNADPTGTNDATTAINNALGALPSGGGTVYFPAGTYTVSGALNVPTGAVLQGAGQDVSIISQTSTTADTFAATDQRYITVRDLQLTGPSSGTGRGIAFLHSSATVAGISLENVIVQDFGGDGVHLETVITSVLTNVRSQSNGGHGFLANNGTSLSFKACYANANTGNGYELDAMNYMQLDSCAADNDTIGYSINGSSAVVLNACGSESCTDGYKILGTSANIVLQGCKVIGETGVGFWVTGSSTFCFLLGCREATPGAGATASFQVDSGSAAIVIDPQNTTGNSYSAGTTCFFQPTNLEVHSSSSTVARISRGGTANTAAYKLQTANSDQWAFGFNPTPDLTSDLYVADSAHTTVLFHAPSQAIGPNLGLFGKPGSYQGGTLVTFIPNATAVPSGTASGGGLLYASAGHLYWCGAAGTALIV